MMKFPIYGKKKCSKPPTSQDTEPDSVPFIYWQSKHLDALGDVPNCDWVFWLQLQLSEVHQPGKSGEFVVS